MKPGFTEIVRLDSPRPVGRVVRHVRRVQLAKRRFDRREVESLPKVLWQGVATCHRRGQALLDEAAQPSPSETAEAPIDRDDTRDFLSDLLDLRVHELQPAATPFPHLPIEIQLRLVFEPAMDPAESDALYASWQKAVTKSFDWVEH